MAKILHIDSSAAKASSSSRLLSSAIVQQLSPESVTYRDISGGLPIISEDFIAAMYTPKEDRTTEQATLLTLSNTLVSEIKNHDIIVMGIPMYNFNVPASVKLYQDLIARTGETFMYTATGPKGLVEGKKIYFALTSGGVPLNKGVGMDHLSASLKSFFSFLGITEQYFIIADGLSSNMDDSLNKAREAIMELN